MFLGKLVVLRLLTDNDKLSRNDACTHFWLVADEIQHFKSHDNADETCLLMARRSCRSRRGFESNR